MSVVDQLALEMSITGEQAVHNALNHTSHFLVKLTREEKAYQEQQGRRRNNTDRQGPSSSRWGAAKESIAEDLAQQGMGGGFVGNAVAAAMAAEGVSAATMGIAGAALAATAATGAFYKSAVQSAMDAEAGARRFEASVKAVGLAYPVEEASAYSSALESITTFSDDAILSTQQLLTTFLLNKAQIQALVPGILDATAALAALGVDADSVSNQIGKAFETGQVGALKRWGITIDEALFKKDRVGAMVHALNRYKGAAVAAAQSPTGHILQQANAWDNLKEAVGGQFLPAIDRVLVSATKVIGVFTALDSATNGVSTRIMMFAGPGGPLMYLVDTLGKVVEGVQQVWKWLSNTSAFKVFENAVESIKAFAKDHGLKGIFPDKKGKSAEKIVEDAKNAPGAHGNPAKVGEGSGVSKILREFAASVNGEIGRIGIRETERQRLGIKPSELPGVRAKMKNAVTVNIQGLSEKSMKQMMEEVMAKSLDQLNRHNIPVGAQ